MGRNEKTSYHLILGEAVKKFIEFSLIWYSQQMAIPFWVVGHVHLSINTYKDIHEIIASLSLNLLVAIGFIIDYKKTTKNKL